MKCEDVWPSLETGGAWRRRWAELHLRHCPSCADAAKRLEEFHRLMTASEPLSPELRGRWLSAVAEQGVQTKCGLTWTQLAIGALAVAAGIAIAVVFWPKHGGIQPRRRPITDTRIAASVMVSEIHVQAIDVSEELGRLLEEITRSEAELHELAEKSTLRQASDQLEMLLAEYEQK